MNIGFTGTNKRMAREWAREIDSATDLKVNDAEKGLAQEQIEETGVQRLGQEDAQDLGKAALKGIFSAPEMDPDEAREQIRRTVAEENGALEEGSEGGAEYAGASARQIRERIAKNEENSQDEQGKGRVAGLVRKGESKLSRQAMKLVKEEISRGGNNPADIQRIWRTERNALIKTCFGRGLGDTN